MHQNSINPRRRDILRFGAAALGTGSLYPITSTFAKSADPIKIGLMDTLTGFYAILGENDVKGAKLAVSRINNKGGVLGRPFELLIEDDAADSNIAVQKARKLIQRDKVDFLAGCVTAVALPISGVAHEFGKVFMDTGAHTDTITGSECHWTTFRVCGTTWTLAAGNARTLFDKFGGNWYFITPDYVFGHLEEKAYTKMLEGFGGKVVGKDLVPLGATDFSANLIKARQANPDVLITLSAGDDLVNCLKQAVQFGLDKRMAIAGGLQELEVVAALPEEARLGWWTFEWYWKQPGVSADLAKLIDNFVTDYKTMFNDVPTARSWFAYAGINALALATEQAGTTDSKKVARALEGLVLPPEVALQPGKCYFRAGDHQLIANAFPGQLKQGAAYPDLVEIDAIIPLEDVMLSPEEAGCKMDWQA